MESRWRFPKIRGYLFGGPYNKDSSILGSTLGSPHLGKLPYGRVKWSSYAGRFLPSLLTNPKPLVAVAFAPREDTRRCAFGGISH